MSKTGTYRIKRLTSLLLLLGSTSQFSCVQGAPGTTSSSEASWPLSGQEVLLEIADPRGTLQQGIYAVNPSEVENGRGTQASLKLVVKNASSPIWSPHHKRFAYLFNEQLWLCDLAGHKVAVSEAPSTNLFNKQLGAVMWAWDGTLFYSLHLPSWRSQTLIGFPAEDAPLEDLRLSEDESFQNKFFAFIPLAHQDPQCLSSSELKWSDVLSTNEASFSPDGRQLAVELYPSSPFDLSRSNSRVQIYKLSKWTQDEKVNDVKAQSARGWFGNTSGYIFASGPGKRLISNTSSAIVELQPRWSPSDQYIALTSVDLSNARVLSLVVSPDGKNQTILTPSTIGPSDRWTPISSAPILPTPSLSKSATVWGDINQTAVTWSEGDYLWMRSGEDIPFAANRKEDSWVTRPIPLVITSENGITYWGCRGSRIVYLQDSGDVRKIYDLTFVDVETSQSYNSSLRPSLEVKAMS